MVQRHLLQGLAKGLRKKSTDVEALLWSRLRNRQIAGVKFRRQQPMERFIVDFVSFEKKLVIELDGSQHSIQVAHDKQKDDCLTAGGFTVLRFWNNAVIENLEGVLEVIREHCL